MRPWGPAVVLLGLGVLLVLALIEAGVVIGLAPAPAFDPVAVSGVQSASDGGGKVFVLNAADDSVWVMDASGDDALEKATSIPVDDEANYLAAGPAPDGAGVELAVAGRNDKAVQLIEYRDDGSVKRLQPLQINPPSACEGKIRTQHCTGVRSLAIGQVGSGAPPALAVGTLGGQVRIFELSGARELRRTITIRGNHRIVEAVAIGDLDGDSSGDVLVRAKGGVLPYLSRPDGSLVPERNKRIHEIAQALAIGDFGPGLRVVLAPLQSDTVELYSWGSTGFAERDSVEAGDVVRSVGAVEPFAGGGQFAVATDEDHVEVFRGKPDGDLDQLAEFESQQPLAARIVLQALLAITLIAVAFAVANPGGGPAAPEALGLRAATRSPVGAAIVAYLAYVGCAYVISTLIHPQQEDVTRDLGFGEGGAGDIISAFLVICAAPVSEELFFRGFMFTGLRQRLPFVLAAAISAGIWGLFHFTGPGSWGVVLQLSVFGLILAWLYERTGSIWPTIAVHALNNVLAFAILTS
jgi:membrane protease YdiL (CAAX protease family)